MVDKIYWRPPDWKGMPKCVRFSVIEPDFLAKEVYEAGADKMLEALRPYLLMALGVSMKLEPLLESLPNARSLTQLRGLTNNLNKITRR